MQELQSDILAALARTMRIDQTQALLKLVEQAGKTNLFKQLQLGQLLQASVSRAGDGQSARLQLANMDVLAHTPLRLPAGQQLQLEVVKTGTVPELRLLGADSLRQLAVQALKASLPQQAPVSRLLQLLQDPAGLESAASRNAARGTEGQPGSTPSPLGGRSDTLPAGGGKAETAARAEPTYARLGAEARAALASQTTTATPARPGNAAGPQPSPAGVAEQAAAGTGRGETRAATQAAQLPDGVKQAAQQLLGGRLSLDRPLTAQILQQAMLGSGLFTEALLGQGRPVPAEDMKSGLLKLLAQLQGAMKARPEGEASAQPRERGSADTAQQAAQNALRQNMLSELMRQAESSLARVQTHQLASLPQDDAAGKFLLQLELPIRHDDHVDDFLLRVEEEDEGGASEGGGVWSVSLSFDIGDLGPVQARLRLQGELLSARFWTHREDTAARFSRHMPVLAEALERAGLQVGRLTATQGEPPEPVTLTRPGMNLLDEKA